MDAAPSQIATGLVLGSGVAQWVSEQIGSSTDVHDCEGIGWARGGKIVMGAMFNNYIKGGSIHIHIARLPEARLVPTFVAAIVDYPFNQLGVRRMSAFIAEDNAPSRALAEHLGGRQEAVLQDALPSGNLVLYGLLRKDAEQWLTAAYSQRLRVGGSDGKREQPAPSA